MNKEIIIKRKNTYYKESIFVNGYAELDINNIKKLLSSRKLLICVTSKVDLKRLDGIDYIYISTKKQYKDIKKLLENNNIIVITYKLIYAELLYYSSLLNYLQKYRFTIFFLNRKRVEKGKVVVDEDFLYFNRMFLDVDYTNKTIKIKEEFKDTNFYDDFELEYTRINGLCKFLLYKVDKFTLESGRPTDDDKVDYKIKYYVIVGKELDSKLFLNKLCEYVPFIYESKDNQWCDVKIIREN
mgnify:CR=1 FL=1